MIILIRTLILASLKVLFINLLNNHFQQYYEVKNYFLEMYPSQMKV